MLVELEDATNTKLTIKVTGFQWGWNYEYLDKGVTLFQRLDRKSDAARELGSGIDPNGVEHYLRNVDHPLVVPVGMKIRLLITGADVIHSWWVPEFGVKKDGIPGFVNEAWFDIDSDKTGIYRGQCAELCGRDHGFMPIVVDARSKEDFDTWLKEEAEKQKQASAPAAATVGVAIASPSAWSASTVSSTSSSCSVSRASFSPGTIKLGPPIAGCGKLSLAISAWATRASRAIAAMMRFNGAGRRVESGRSHAGSADPIRRLLGLLNTG